jgi:hypothetical protein
MRLLERRGGVLGVRGETTRRALQMICGVQNVFVTGCPSFFSRPNKLRELHENPRLDGRPAFCGTRYHRSSEQQMLHRAVDDDSFLAEPVNKFMHQYFVQTSRGEHPDVPYFLTRYRGRVDDERRAELRAYCPTTGSSGMWTGGTPSMQNRSRSRTARAST